MVPTGSPLRARVRLPFFSPLMTCTERRCLAVFMRCSTVPRAKDFADEVAAGISAVRWDAANLRVGLPISVGRHADSDTCLAFGQIEGQLCELGGFDRWDPVLGQEIMDHLGVLYAHKKAKHAQDAGRHAKIEADAVGVPGPRACAGADNHFVRLITLASGRIAIVGCWSTPAINFSSLRLPATNASVIWSMLSSIGLPSWLIGAQLTDVN